MKSYTEKQYENQHHSAANVTSQRQAGVDNSLQFVDNRAEASNLQKLQVMVDNSPRLLAQRQIVSGDKLRQFSLQSVVQLVFDAGEGGKWHIHHEHIKLGNNNDSRINFNGRPKKEIRKELGEKIDRYGLNVGGDLAASFRECIDYINANY